jgi:pyrroline-5-carboxylate reductase
MQPRISVIGGGHMARALISGLIGHGTPPQTLRVGEPLPQSRDALSRDFGLLATADNNEAIADADLVVIAVKPQQAATVLTPLRPRFQSRRPVVLSVAAGISVASLQSWVGAGVAVVRSMPNRPALVGAGISGLYAGPEVNAAQRQLAETALRASGAVVWLEREEDIDAVIAVSGSGPAYFFLLAELMMRHGMQLGLTPSVARQLAVGTLHGAGALAHASADGDLERLRAEVTSKGGTTAAAVAVFESQGLPRMVAAAMDAASRRSRELAAEFGGPGTPGS